MEISLEVFYHIPSYQLSNCMLVLLPTNSLKIISFQKQKGISMLSLVRLDALSGLQELETSDNCPLPVFFVILDFGNGNSAIRNL